MVFRSAWFQGLRKSCARCHPESTPFAGEGSAFGNNQEKADYKAPPHIGNMMGIKQKSIKT
jgi:hypothetical protein